MIRERINIRWSHTNKKATIRKARIVQKEGAREVNQARTIYRGYICSGLNVKQL